MLGCNLESSRLRTVIRGGVLLVRYNFVNTFFFFCVIWLVCCEFFLLNSLWFMVTQLLGWWLLKEMRVFSFKKGDRINRVYKCTSFQLIRWLKNRCHLKLNEWQPRRCLKSRNLGSQTQNTLAPFKLGHLQMAPLPAPLSLAGNCPPDGTAGKVQTIWRDCDGLGKDTPPALLNDRVLLSVLRAIPLGYFCELFLPDQRYHSVGRGEICYIGCADSPGNYGHVWGGTGSVGK